MKQPLKPYYILFNGEWVGETWAVSEAKAVNNYWWKNVKGCDRFADRKCEPSDFEAITAI